MPGLVTALLLLLISVAVIYKLVSWLAANGGQVKRKQQPEPDYDWMRNRGQEPDQAARPQVTLRPDGKRQERATLDGKPLPSAKPAAGSPPGSKQSLRPPPINRHAP